MRWNQNSRPTTEPSKWLPIALSVLAIIVSGLSLWESHRGRLINEEVNRPILQIDSITHNTVWSNRDFVRLRIHLKNIGKTTAVLDQWTVLVLPEAVENCELKTLDPKESVETGVQQKEIFAGLSQPLIQDVGISGCKNVSKTSLFLPIVVEYVDAGSGHRYSQNLLGSVQITLHDNPKPE